jgi:hypothetical protein
MTMETMNAIPSCYFSRTDGQWSIIYREMPICAPTTFNNADAVAKAMERGPKFTSQAKVERSVFWDGEKGEFVPFS